MYDAALRVDTEAVTSIVDVCFVRALLPVPFDWVVAALAVFELFGHRAAHL
jgi:hypothetical protein